MTNAERQVEALLAEVERLREEAEGQEERVSKWRNLAYDKAREVERLARKLADPPPPLPGFVNMRYWDEAEERFDDRQWMADQRQPGEW